MRAPDYPERLLEWVHEADIIGPTGKPYLPLGRALRARTCINDREAFALIQVSEGLLKDMPREDIERLVAPHLDEEFARLAGEGG